MSIPKHPAQFSAPILEAIRARLVDEIALRGDRLTVLDPFAGPGDRLGPLVRALKYDGRRCLFRGIELEPEWAEGDRDVKQGDATDLRLKSATVDVLVTSPCYGNRMADHHTPSERDRCRVCCAKGCYSEGTPDPKCKGCNGSGLSTRHTYRHQLGRKPSIGSAAVLNWGSEYRALHRAAWREAARVVVDGGLVMVNISNHVRGSSEQLVSEWHLTYWLQDLGAQLVDVERIETRRQQHGANRELRTECEFLLVLRNRNQAQGALL